MSKCKNCGHKIVQMINYSKWYHISTWITGNMKRSLPTGKGCPKHKSNGVLCNCTKPEPKKVGVKGK